MSFKNIDKQIIQKYQEDEQMMVRLFVQWCSNHQLDPQKLYQQAYPAQQENEAMQKIIKEAVNEEVIHIDNGTMLDILQLFGNDDLAFIVAEEIDWLSKK